jgi:RNA polymerase sigma-70 factor (ECF subfamily)
MEKKVEHSVDIVLEQKDSKPTASLSAAVQNKDISDEALVEMVQNGSESAFAELTKRYMHKSYSIAYQLVGDSEVARDLSQDVFLKIYQSIHRFKKDNKFFSWFYRILLNHCINYTRRRKIISFLPLSQFLTHLGEIPEDPNVMQETGEDSAERQRIVHKAIDRLSAKHRNVVILCDIEEISQEAAAEILGIAIGTVRSRLHYARKHLKQLLQQYITEL